MNDCMIYLYVVMIRMNDGMIDNSTYTVVGIPRGDQLDKEVAILQFLESVKK